MSDAAAVQLGFALPLHADADDPPPSLGHRSPRWSDWDGGKCGGRPSWLNPRDLPAAPLRCRRPCSDGEKEGTALRFVAQLYCPADDATGNEAAFHRSAYVFACPMCCNASDDGAPTPRSHHLSSCVRVLRCQLPKRNDFYPATGDCDDEGWTRHTSEHWAKETNDDQLNLCAVCRQRSRGKCPKQQLWFCGPEHQKECLRASKLHREEGGDFVDIDGLSSKHLPSVCYESELVVEEEPSAADSPSETNEATNSLFPYKDITDADAELEQKDLNAFTGNTALATAATGVTDTTTLAFYARMAVGLEENDVRDQCLRYCRWPESNRTQDSDEASGGENDETGPLWISSNHRPPAEFPPPCERCGAERAFEFQILPQMLHSLLHDPDEAASSADARPVLTEAQRAVLLEAQSYIESGADLPEGFREEHEAAVANARQALLGGEKDAKGEGAKGGLDWGTIAVYTCTASCGGGGEASAETGAYIEEVAWVQPPLDSL
ncbi:hypothetical protein ACHAXT_002283 [Thalassiosira profunda]